VTGEAEPVAGVAGSSATPRRFVAWLVLIALGGVVIRVIYTLHSAPWPPSGLNDQGFYEVQADLVAHGHGFLDPFKALNHIHAASVGHPPLYVVALAGVTTLTGASGGDLRFAGAAFGAITIIALGLLGRRLGGDRVGLLAAGIAAIYPMQITADGALMSETLYGALLALALVAAYRLLDVRSWGRAAVFGALVGLAALTRGDALLLLPLAMVPVFRRPGGKRATLIACAAVAVVLTPWTIRNEVVFHQFLPISSDTTVAGANCHETYYGPHVGSWSLNCIKPYPGNEAEAISRAEHDAFVYASDHVARLPVVAGARLVRTWATLPGDLSNLEGRSLHVVDVGYLMYYVLVVLAAYGIVLLRRRAAELWIIVSPLVLVVLTSVLIYGGVRFRQAAELSLIVLGAVAVDHLWQRLRDRRTQRLRVPAPPLDFAAGTGD
jgi:hypothetical protein